MPSWKLIAAWVVVVVATTLLAWQIVSLADSQVSATPVEIITATTSPSGDSTTTSPTSSSAPVTVTTDSTSSTSSTSSTADTGPTTVEWSVRTVTSQGGTVIVRHRPGEVELQAATPLPGFVMEIDDAGPDRVRVEFENDDVDVRVEIRPSGDGLAIKID